MSAFALLLLAGIARPGAVARAQLTEGAADGTTKSIFDEDDLDSAAPPVGAKPKPSAPTTPADDTPTPDESTEPATPDGAPQPPPAQSVRPVVVTAPPPAAAGGTSGPAAPPVVKSETLLPVPDPAVQDKALKQIKDQFKAEYKATGAARVELARQLLTAGAEPSLDPDTRFVLFREARDIAAAAGDPRTGLAASRHLAGRYAVDLTEMGLTVLMAAARGASTPERAADVTGVALVLLARATDARQFDVAARICGIAQASSRLMKSPALVANLQALDKDLKNRKANADKLAAARQTLSTNPADPEANAVVGRQLCLDDGRWDDGLPLLAKGSDPALKMLAAKDLATPKTESLDAAMGQAEAANAWWTTAQGQPLTAKLRMQERAAHWYAKAQGKLLGAKRDQAAARVAAAHGVLPEVALVRLPVAADPARAARERQALAATKGARPFPVEKVEEALLIEAGKPYVIPKGVDVSDKHGSLEITVGPGAEIRGGKIYLATKGKLVLRGSAEQPVVLRNVTIVSDLNGTLEAEYAVLDNCKFQKGGVWWAYNSTKWVFNHSLLYKCTFGALKGVDYGFKITDCRLVGMTLPEVANERKATEPFNHTKRLGKGWNLVSGCELVDCAVSPTFAWCASGSNFIGCKFMPGEAYEDDNALEWRAFVAETVGSTPQAVFDQRPGPRAKVRVLPLEQPAVVERVGEGLIPELAYQTRAVKRDE